MLHIWLIPMLLVLVAILVIFYLVIKSKGGPGVRTEGRTMVHKPEEEQDLPPS